MTTGLNQASNTSRSRSSCAVGRASTSANVEPARFDLRYLRHRVTGREHAAHASRSSRSPGCRSASTVTNGSESLPESPVPTAIVRTPLRFECTGIACSGSLIRITSAVPAFTLVTCPKMPSPSSTAWPLNTPSTAPLSSSTRWRNGSRSTFRIEATSTRSATPAVFARISTQAPVFVLERRKSLQLQVGQTQTGREFQVFLAQAPAIGERTGHPAPGAKRKIDDPLHGMHDRAEPLAHLVDLVVALVGDHQPDRDRREHDERRH